jgi:23S rRNA (uracil1939-C5)-methyltransferase
LANETYFCGDVNEMIKSLLGRYHPETVILDPSAEGVDARVIDTLTHHPLPQLVYVSCNPGTLARDLARLQNQYRIVAVQPFDMFPQTAEIEAVAVLELLSSNRKTSQ